MEIATLAGGCFWCTEAIFERLKGVKKVVVGYSGGETENPSYESLGEHAESIQITYEPKIISYEKLLEVFFKLHDPTTKDRQGVDVGHQYRSIIFFRNKEQKKIAEKLKSKIPNAVTEIAPFKKFYRAENEHQNYYDKNRNASYCKLVIDPKIQKLYKEFEAITEN